MSLLTLSYQVTNSGDPARNLALDEELLAAGAPVFRLWESDRVCVVVGRSGRLDRDDVPVLRRGSGGGAVVLGPGCLNYSLVLPVAANPAWTSVHYSLQWVMTRMRDALAVPGLSVEGDCDLALDGRKVSGNAQRRTHSAILHHGTLLYDFDPELAEKYLAIPLRAPAYRRGRGHREFLGNLPLTAEDIRQRLLAYWLAVTF